MDECTLPNEFGESSAARLGVLTLTRRPEDKNVVMHDTYVRPCLTPLIERQKLHHTSYTLMESTRSLRILKM